MYQLKGSFVKGELKKFTDKVSGKEVEWFNCLFISQSGQLMKVYPVKEIRDEIANELGSPVTINFDLSTDDAFFVRLKVLNIV